MRGFFAFGIQPDFARELRAAADQFPVDPGLRLLPPADYHVTIKFLSEFSSTHFFACLDELCAIGPPPTDSLRAGKLAYWPTVLALECEPSEALSEWHGRVNALLERKGFIHERHPRFHPHVTVARIKMGRKVPAIDRSMAVQFNGRPVAVTAPALWKSQAEETGRRHLEFLSPLMR